MTPFTRGHALIIGIGTYVHAPRQNVPMTAADAKAVADVVQDAQLCGYPPEQVKLLRNSDATRDGILAALDGLAQTSKEDTVFVFYSGHGAYDTSSNYTLTTHETTFDKGRVAPGTAISEAELLTRLRAIPAERVLLLFNACHGGEISPTLEGEATATGDPLPEKTANALLSTGSGRIVITACRENQYSFVGSGTQTLFAQALVEGLRGGGDVINRKGFISAFDLYTHLYYTVTEAVQREVSEAVRNAYGGKQEPELTILKGIGPFAVALYRGAMVLGAFPADHAPGVKDAVREVDAARSKRALDGIVGTATVQGDNSGINVGVNTGTVSQQNIRNQAPNQGAQGTFEGPVTFNQQRSSVFNQEGQTVHGGQYNAGRDQINAQGSQGFINQPTGSVSQQFGGTRISGGIKTGDVSGSGIAIGHQAQAQVQNQQGGGADAFAQAFARIYQAINARPHDPNFGPDDITKTVQEIEQEAKKGDQANEARLTLWLRNLAAMADDIFDVTVAALTGPQAALATVASKVAAKAKQERGNG